LQVVVAESVSAKFVITTLANDPKIAEFAFLYKITAQLNEFDAVRHVNANVLPLHV
jgi:hypothetical protein